MSKDGKNEGGKPVLRNPLLDRVKKQTPRRTDELLPEERAELKQNKYAVQSAALNIGKGIYDETKEKGEEYTPEKGNLLKLAQQAVREGNTKGGKINFSMDEADHSKPLSPKDTPVNKDASKSRELP